MVYPEPLMWASPLIAGLICGIVRGCSYHRDGYRAKRGITRFVGSYASIPAVSAALLCVVVLSRTVIGLAVEAMAVDPDALVFGLPIMAAFSVFPGYLLGIPAAWIVGGITIDLRSALSEKST